MENITSQEWIQFSNNQNYATNTSANQIRRLSITQCYDIFSNPQNVRNLFRCKNLILFPWSEPHLVNENTLKLFSKHSNVSASFGVDGSTCESIAFTTTQLILTSSVRVDVFVHGSNLAPQLVLQHTYFWLCHLTNIVSPEIINVALSVCFPLNVNKDYVRKDLTLKLEEPLSSSTFDSDEVIYVKYPINLTINPKTENKIFFELIRPTQNYNIHNSWIK